MPGAVWVLRTEENIHPSDTRNRTWAVEPIAKHIAAWATWAPPLRKPWHEYNHLFPTLKKHIFSVMSPLWTNAFSSFCKTNIPAILFLFEFEKLRQYSCCLSSGLWWVCWSKGTFRQCLFWCNLQLAAEGKAEHASILFWFFLQFLLVPCWLSFLILLTMNYSLNFCLLVLIRLVSSLSKLWIYSN